MQVVIFSLGCSEWSEWQPNPCKIGETQVRLRVCRRGNTVGPIQMQRRPCPIGE